MKKENKYLYALQLENDCYYIGQTRDLDKRFNQHKKGIGAIWTSIHKPIKMIEFWSIGEYTQDSAMQFENEMTIKYMDTYGIQNVRGGDFCITNDENHLGLVKSKTQITGEIVVSRGDQIVKKKYASIKLKLEKIIQENISYIYVLELEDNNIYINSSKKIIKDLKRHFFGNGSRWSFIHRPKGLLEIIENKDLGFKNKKPFENEIVEKYMKTHGIENVRGGDYKIIEPKTHMRLVRKKLPHLLKITVANNS